MAAHLTPIIMSGVFYPKNKKDPPQPGTFIGNAALPYVDISPPDPQPPGGGEQPPLVIWGGGNEPFPTPPIYWPGFPDSPPPEIEPPPEFPNPGPVKPFPEGGGWGYSDRTGWVFKPGPTDPTPKGPRGR